MNTVKITPAAIIMIIAILLSCFAFLFSTTGTQQIAAAIICAISFTFFCLVQWVDNAAPKK